MLTDIDSRLIGYWRITAHEAVEGAVLRVIGGIPDYVVRFDERGRYTIVTDPRRPLEYHYRSDNTLNPATIDLWMSDPEFFTLGIYRFDGDELVMCLAAELVEPFVQRSGPRSEARKREAERIRPSRPYRFDRTSEPNWVLRRYVRCEAPKPKKRRKRVNSSTGPGSLIPTENAVDLMEFLAGKGKLPKGSSTAWLPFCSIDVKAGALWAGDPHLANADDGCVVQVTKGNYQVEGVGAIMGRNRVVCKLRVRLTTESNPELGEEVGETGTDSAMMGVCDIEAFDAACGPDNGDIVQEAIESQTGEGFGIITISLFPGAVMPFVPTGSDGGGRVRALVASAKCVGIHLSFTEEEEPG